MSRTPNLSRTTTTTTLSDSSLSRRSSGSFSRASASAASVSSVSSTSFTTLFARDEEEDQEIGDDTLSEESLDSESEGSLESFTEGSLENPIRGSSQESLPCSSQGSLPSSSQDSLDGPISPTVSKTMIRAAIDKVAAKRLTERGVPRACYTPKWISNKTERNTQDIDGRMALWGSPCKPKTKDWMKFQRDEYLREQRKYEKSEDALMDLFFEPWKPKVVQHRFNFGYMTEPEQRYLFPYMFEKDAPPTPDPLEDPTLKPELKWFINKMNQMSHLDYELWIREIRDKNAKCKEWLEKGGRGVVADLLATDKDVRLHPEKNLKNKPPPPPAYIRRRFNNWIKHVPIAPLY